MMDEPTNVLLDNATESVAAMMRLARDEAWNDTKIASHAEMLISDWRDRDIELSRMLENLRGKVLNAMRDESRIRAALLDLLSATPNADNGQHVLGIGYLAEEAASTLRWTQTQLREERERADEALTAVNASEATINELRTGLFSTERGQDEALLRSEVATARSNENHREALRAIGALEAARIERNQYSDALRSLQRQCKRWEMQRDEWMAALGVGPGDVDAEPEQAAEAFLGRNMRGYVNALREPINEGDGNEDWHEGAAWVLTQFDATARNLGSDR
jgi:hypothetical protein